jgi:pentatricopeptide repeat protein
MVVYYAKRGDKHHARATFENMRTRGIEPNAFVFTRWVHCYCRLVVISCFFFITW